ncbi:hypothetical protein BX600DRAFT_507820 [Xylariales sp. PMI_506]|nr:hypothetical protein BX600DRAFT_507820 [Xylariales sp. PMI_506]
MSPVRHVTLQLLVLLLVGVCSASPALKEYLQLTAVVSAGDDGRAALECWEMAMPFFGYPTVGSSISGLANVSNVSYVVLPSGSNEGLHKPPHPMFFVLLSGVAHVTLPHGDGDELWIRAGVNGLIVAVDTRGDGHVTEYPGDQPAAALQIPFLDGVVPEHRVVKRGVCAADEEAARGLRGLDREFLADGGNQVPMF